LWRERQTFCICGKFTRHSEIQTRIKEIQATHTEQLLMAAKKSEELLREMQDRFNEDAMRPRQDDSRTNIMD